MTMRAFLNNRVCQYEQALLLLIWKSSQHQLVRIEVVVEVRLALPLRHPLDDTFDVGSVLVRLARHEPSGQPGVGA